MRILINDHNASYHWHFHAQDKNPEYNYIKTLREIIERFKIDVTFTLQDGGYAYRTRIYPDYKAQREVNRQKKSEADQKAYTDFRKESYRFAKNVLPMLGMRTLRVQGCEADDLAAYLVKHIDKEQHQILLLSSDKDWHQNLQKGVVQASYTDIKNSPCPIPASVWLNEKAFEEKYGLTVDQWIWFKCLHGDTGDNVKGGAPFLGESSAMKLMQKYGNVENIAANVNNLDIPRMRKESKAGLQESFDQVYLNYKVMNLNHSPQEERDIIGEEGIAYLEAAIKNLHLDNYLDKDAFTEVGYRSGWLLFTEDEEFFTPFL